MNLGKKYERRRSAEAHRRAKPIFIKQLKFETVWKICLLIGGPIKKYAQLRHQRMEFLHF
jgi:hypothetical protein